MSFGYLSLIYLCASRVSDEMTQAFISVRIKVCSDRGHFVGRLALRVELSSPPIASQPFHTICSPNLLESDQIGCTCCMHFLHNSCTLQVQIDAAGT